ncbi:hypothetical protein BLNAU_1306 [Blattamonas nauphoetae]|uniref:Protein kinase domain-containing protein n=1 Tax=Blattamonas nauphoetae TaxID=2049346 RepID=A0ABQ9YJH6_9EUKA|nr:hypothetical protein BLNAU_1306 [Blattamonas nauphoetae]
MIIFCFLSTTIILTIASGGKETESRSLRLFLDEHIQKSNNDHYEDNDIIRLPNGKFSSCGYPVISRTLNVEGMKTEVHISVERDVLETDTQNGFDSSSTGGDSLLSIFRIRNSTVSLSSLCLNSEAPSSLIASVTSSFVTVSESDIRSNGMNSPFVMLVGNADGQSRDLGSSLHLSNCRHISSSLVSLVPLAEISRKSDLAVNARKSWTRFEEAQFVEEMRISASELAISDCCLTFGTGPLIGFGCDKDQSELSGEQAVLPWKVSSQLVKSQITNTTSNPSDWIVCEGELERMELSQRLTSSCVCLSTNHLYGTACVDMNANVMGSLLSLNTSFSSCLTDAPTHLNQHFKTQQTPTQSAFFKLCTFKDCSSTSSYGGAINSRAKGALLVEDCSFQLCQCTGTGSGAGAIFYAPSWTISFIVVSSSFIGCSSAYYGGSIVVSSCKSSTLLNCVFIDSKALSNGGSVYLHNWDALSTSSSITNCLFENCQTTHSSASNPYSGGALYITEAVSLQLNFVNFRGNKAGVKDGNDIMFSKITPSRITPEMMVGCTSTSNSPRQQLYPAVGTDEHLTNPTTTATHVSWNATEIDANTAKFTLKMNETITGTVLVLIDNSGGTRTPTSGQAPNIGRVLSFSLDDTDESSCSVSLGEDGLVQTPLKAYQVITSSFVGSFILSTDCVLDESEKNVLITISGRNIASGILHVTLSDNTVLNFQFKPHQTTSEVLNVPLTVDSPMLIFGKTYKIVSARSPTQSHNPITLPYDVEIIVPSPPRLTTLKESVYDEKKKTVSIDLEGVNLDGTYKVTLSVNDTETMTFDVVFSSSKFQFQGILFDTETPTKVNMSYNTRYEIVGMKQGEENVLCLGDLSFTTMAEPTRLVTMECEFDKAKKNVLIQIFGRELETTSTYKVGLSISGTLKHTVSMTFNSSSELWEGSALLYPSSSAQLGYGKTYSVSSFQKGGNTTELFFEANSIEITPEPQRLVKVESINADGLNSTTLTLSSLALAHGAKYALELKGTPLDSSSNSAHVVPLSFTATSQSTHSFTLSLYPTDEAKLKYGHSYSVDWMKTGDTSTIIETDACTFSTSVLPERLVKISCDEKFSDSKKKTITVTFESLGLKSLTEYSIVFKSTTTAEVLSHTKKLKLKTDANGLLPSHTAVLFPTKTDTDERDGQLEFGLTYSVDGFKRGEETLLYDTEHITLTTPLEPARLTGVSYTGSTDKEKKATLTVMGRKMSTDETYTLTLKVKDKTSNSQPTVNVSFTTAESGTGSAVLFSTTSSEIQLNYNTSYEVIGVTDSATSPILFEDGLTFTTIVEPTRLVTMECGYDESKKTALIRMTGQVLDTTKEYEIELNDSENLKKTIEMTFNTTSSKWEGSAILYSLSEPVELEYGKTYFVSGFKTKGETSPHLYEDLSITIENEPSRVEEVSRMLNGKKTTMIISLSGRELKNGMGKLGVCRGNSKWTSEIGIVLASDGKWKTEFRVDFSESSTVLEYGSTYTLCGLDGSAFFVNEGISITVPHAPVVSSMIPELNADTHRAFRVVMSGSDLPTAGSYTASFSDNLGSFDISLSELSEWRSDWIEVTKTSAFEFNKTCTLASLIDSSSGSAEHILCSGVTMKTPLGPTLTGFGGVSLTGSSLDCVSIVVNVARIVADTFEVSGLDVDDASKVLIPLIVSFSSCDSTEGAMTHSVSWDSALQYGHRYEIALMSSSTMAVSIPSKLVFEVPIISSFDNVLLSHNSINTFIRVQFSGNGFLGQYSVTLNSGFSFVVAAQSDTSAVSEEIALGWPDSLTFDTPFTVQSVISTIPDSVVLLKNMLTFTTPPKPDPLSLFVDRRTGVTSQFCGESSRPCSSVEVAWEIISQLGVPTPTVGIVHSATLGSPIRISNGMVALLSSSGNVDPKLRIPLSARENDESGMIVVSSSTLQIRDVEIVMDTLSPSFVLLFAENSNLTLKEGSFVGPQSTPPSNEETSANLCDWTSGILQLDNCNTSIIFTVLANLSFGAVNMKAGSLKVETSSFHDNSPNITSFTSLRRNIHCSNGGHIEIGSLNGGDGIGDKMGWFSRSDCTLSGDGVDIETAFFAPKLNTNESTTTYTKKTNTFEVEIVGSVLIPCGLFLEVFETTKDKKEADFVQFELSLDSTQSFTEKNIKLAISQAELKKLNSELEWRGRLVFGESHRTVETILIQKNISERRSEATLNNMKWWLPVVIVVSLILLLVVIVIVCFRRRKNGKEAGATTSLTEMEEQEDNVEKIAVNVEDEHNLALIRTTREEQHQQESMKEAPGQGESTKKDGNEDEMKLEEIEAVVCDREVKVEVVGKRETLFERLHGQNKKKVDAIVVCRALIKGLVTAGKDERLNGVLLTLSPHTIIVDSSNRICVVTPSEAKGKVGTELGKEMNGSVVEGEERWRAPEQGNVKIEAGMGSEKVSVFRLGLLLLEMWTGRIPFGETDGVNASRQLGMGILPPLEGMSSEMEEIVRRCLSVDFQDRPRLTEVDELLQSLSQKDDRKVERVEEMKKLNLAEMLGTQSLVS